MATTLTVSTYSSAVPTLRELAAMEASLEARYADKLTVNASLTRQLVSFQANKTEPVLRWFRYKEGFSSALVRSFLESTAFPPGPILDPFAGVGTTLYEASSLGRDSFGIELLPVGVEVMRAREAASLLSPDEVAALGRIAHERPWKSWVGSGMPFPHLRITRDAFPADTEVELGRYLAFAHSMDDPLFTVLRFAALCILEPISFTRKDGQYLRWDHRSGRRQGKKPFDKGRILGFEAAIGGKLAEICADLNGPGDRLQGLFDEPIRGRMTVAAGSLFERLSELEPRSIAGVITSPPYCNRYDYTRTYALELAALGVGEERLKELRQSLLTCTVENREKVHLSRTIPDTIWRSALEAFHCHEFLQGTLAYLRDQRDRGQLNNDGIARMVEGYFLEMTVAIFQLAEILSERAPIVMVNDNVRYAGASIPVDLILSDFAMRAGLRTERIWVLPTGKGNSSQQMGEHGRKELRKCVYVWRKS
ncbi:MAG: hypothetical protein AMXMBFR19_23630 [Chthonomonadaceae bacterium]|uniref:site-specific DNA-methyltransferase (cytosine-N(4)-specific) n=1 Tax=Candidatus Nitrosymbiomonas proteolyticus TaxID=2608984 RepID=A0A809SBA0_9BACT|nr:MAG: Methyltransferase domain protein [Armatimonadetes bacterium OLB18]BBO24831.1 methyltransferase domain protein [Candidatus Nitrosymbiomonas proteolyticus]